MTETSQTKPTQQSILFARGVIARLAVWSTLRIAVQENWGGVEAKQKPTWIASTIVDSFEGEENERPDEEYIEDMLLQIMEDEFEAVLEDDSVVGVSKDIVRMWVETREGKDDTVRKYEELAEKIKGKAIQVHADKTNDDDGEDWEDDEDGEDYMEDEEAPQLLEHTTPARTQKNEPEVDEDGFTVVKGKGKGRR